MAFAKIPLMIENHSRYKANKDKRQGELSFIGIYTQLKAYILALLTRILIIILKKPHAIGLRLRAMNPMTN
jgi:hypothetical protein